MNITTGKIAATASLIALTLPAAADQQILDDLIVDGSACVGQDCVNGESFGFDTIRVKENNLRIRAFDTSNTASFPTRDWQITFNDSTNGGQNKFSIDDIDGGRTPFTIEGSAPSHSLYVDDSGRIGFGLSTPVVELHVRDGDTPTLRLEQDGSSGFAPQTWDVAGNETNFFVRDVSNGSTLPFRIRPTSPTSMIDIRGDQAVDRVDLGGGTPRLSVLSTGNVGVGTTTPDDELDIESDEATTDLRLTSTGTGGAIWRMRANAGNSTFTIQDGETNDSTFKIKEAAGNNRLVIDSSGAVGINTANPDAAAALDVNGPVYLRGAELHADYVFASDYELESIDEHAAFMWKHKHLPAVSKRQLDEAGSEFISIGEDRRGIVEELEKAHIYIEQLHKGLRNKEAELDVFAERLERLESQLAVSTAR